MTAKSETETAAFYTRQFEPLNLAADLRMAHALEYIAFNVGIIARAVERAGAPGTPDSSLARSIMDIPQSRASEAGAIIAEALNKLRP